MRSLIKTSICVILVVLYHCATSIEADSDYKDLESVLNDLGLTKYLQLLKKANLHELLHPRDTVVSQKCNRFIDEFSSRSILPEMDYGVLHELFNVRLIDDCYEPHHYCIAFFILQIVLLKQRRTLFVPSNEAFEQFESQFSQRPLDGKILADFLNYHSSNNLWLSKSWQNEQLLPTSLYGNSLRINIYDQPKNDTKIYTVNGAPILSLDNMAMNGVIHVLGNVIYPAPPLNAYDTLKASNEEIEHFFEHIIASKLLQKLKYDEPMTVFIPIDVAFKKLPHTFMDNFIGEVPVVAAVIYYHIVNGTYHIAGLNDKMRLRTLEGSALAVEHAGAGDKYLITVNKEAKVLRSYPTKNGVIHIVDTVLFPPANPKQMMYARKDQLSLPPIRRK